MKKVKSKALAPILLFWILGICIFSTLTYANIPQPIANYQMDECYWNGTSGEVKDSSGNDLNGTAKNGANTENNVTAGGGICHVGKFDGTSYVDISDNSLLKPAGAFSVSVWFKANELNTWQGVVSKLTDVNHHTGRGWNIQVGKAQKIASLMADSNGSYVYLRSTTIPVVDHWYHIVLVHHSNNVNDLYVNGIKEASNTHEIAFTDNDLQIGKFYTNSNYLKFKGDIDEFKIFDKDLNSTEITDIYNNEKSGKNYDGSDRMCKCVDPVVNYRMDECDWNGNLGEVKDSSGNGYDGTAKNNATTETNTTAGGGICHVGVFDGNDTVELPSNTNLQTSGSQTYMAWIKHDPSNKQLSDIFMNGGRENALRMQDNNKILFQMQIGSEDRELYSTSPINDDKWHFIAGVYDKTNKKMKLYVDGDLNNTLLDVNGSLYVYTGKSYIASENNNGYYFDGDIDEVKVFDKDLNAMQIQTIYNNEKSNKNYNGTNRICPFCGPYIPIANYQMDECYWNGTNGEVKDSSGNNLNGTAKNGVTTESNITAGGGLCQVGKFDGNGYARVPNNIMLDPVGAFSVSVWFKANSISTWQGVVSKLTDVNHNTGRGWNIQIGKAQKIASLMADSSGGYVYLRSNITPEKNVWYHVVLVHHNDNKNDLYINGVKEKSNTHAIAFTNNDLEIGKFYTNSNSLKFDGQIDELKLYNYALTDNAVSDIYDNEKDGKNYDGTNRICLSCSGGIFDAWDTFRGINDRNISTEIVNQEFNLTIASLDKNKTKYQEFNGTVCAKVDNNITKLDFRDQNKTNATFKISRAIRDAKVELSWEKNIDENCPLKNENNESNSSDDFAIRPKEFNISNYPSIVYAGEDFNISFEALDNDDANTTDYNESNGSSFDINVTENKSGCITGTYSGDVNFSDGGNTTVANYDEVSDNNLSIKIYEINGSEFAKVDEDDTNDTARLIKEKDINITVKPYDLNLTYDITPKDWVYMDSNLSQPLTYVELNATLDAYAKNRNKPLQDFNSTCYAKDINISFLDTNITNNDDFNGTYYDVIKDDNLTDINFTKLTKDHNWTIGKKDFISGEGNLSIRFNVDRNYSKPISPVDVNFTDINITTPNIAKNENNKSMDKNISFYYGRVVTHDIETTEQNITSSFLIDVYCNNCSNQINHFFQDSLNWYRNELDNGIIQKNDIEIYPKSDIRLSSSDKSDINISHITDAKNGKISFDVNNSKNSYDTAVFHIFIPKWLWFNDYRAYDDNSSSDCSTHPCIGYKLLINTEKSIESGNFEGSDIGHEQNRTIKKIGVKVYR